MTARLVLDGKLNRFRNFKHGKAGTRVYVIWKGIKARCLNPKTPNYRNYGGRGITVCDRWLEKFENFLEDMGEPLPHQSIDRINNDGNYEPGNCRWANDVQQSNNCRTNRILRVKGEKLSLAEASRKYKIDSHTLWCRLDRGWNVEEAVTRKRRLRKRIIEINGKRLTIAEAAKVYGIPISTINERLKRGWSAEDAVFIPAKGRPREERSVEVDGKKLTVADAARFCGMPYGTLDGRVRRGWSAEDAVTRKVETKYRKKAI